jgi:DNA-binding NarL/FixJ family response regulator
MSTRDPQAIHLLLVEDHGIVRAGLRMLIENWPNLRVVGEASNRTEALALAAVTRPDIILLDIYLGGDSSLSFLPELLAAAPQARVLVLTAVTDREVHQRAVRLGALGVVLKDQAAEVLAEAIAKVHAGEVWLDAALIASVLTTIRAPSPAAANNPVAARIATLTEREREITTLLAEGLSNKQIAEHLTISETTVSHHLTSIFHKLDIATRLELVVFAYRHGLAQPQP